MKILPVFLANFSSNGGEIFWLDYTNLTLGRFEEFMSVLRKVSENSVVKITIRAEPSLKASSSNDDRDKEWEDFKKKYDQILPPSAKQTDIEKPLSSRYTTGDFRVASQQALPASGESVFQLLDSSHYSDQTHMLSITGIVCNKSEISKIRQWFKNWEFKNLDWAAPRRIDVPILSIKERLHLKSICQRKQKQVVPYHKLWDIEYNSDPQHLEKLKQYEEFISIILTLHGYLSEYRS